jgi:hypothetical protein
VQRLKDQTMSKKRASGRNSRRDSTRPVKRKDPLKSQASDSSLIAPGTHPLRPLQIALDVLLTRAAELLVQGGMDLNQIERALRAKADSIADGKWTRIREEASHFGLLKQVSGVLHDWWREPRFISANGTPKALPIRGRGVSLSALVARRVPLSKVPAAIEWMEKAGLFTRTENGLATTTKRAAIIERGSPGPLMSERGLILATHLLSTASHNYRLDEKLPGLMDRQVHVARLSLKHFRQFRELVRLHGGLFLETIDNWLEDHQTDRPGESAIEAGVHLYMFKGRSVKTKRRTSS